MLKRFVLIFSCLTLLFAAFAYALPTPEDAALYDNFIRLHVIANSDSESDQKLKLEVRDEILEYMSGIYEKQSDFESARELINGHLDDIQSIAGDFLKEKGYGYPVSATLTSEYYPTREYEGVSLPAGKYLSLRVIIGEGEGKNWWCVIFPSLCLDASAKKEKLSEAGFTPSQIKIITGGEKYKLKFRILELFGEIGEWLD